MTFTTFIYYILKLVLTRNYFPPPKFHTSWSQSSQSVTLTPVLQSLCNLSPLFLHLPYPYHLQFHHGPRQISSVTILPKSLNLKVFLLFPMPSRLLLLQIYSRLSFLLPLSGFSMLHTKFGTTTNAWSLIHAVFKDALSWYIFWVRSLQPFQQPSSPFLYCPLLLCIRNAFISFLLPHTMKGCYHVRTLFPATSAHNCIHTASLPVLWSEWKARKCPFWD